MTAIFQGHLISAAMVPPRYSLLLELRLIFSILSFSQNVHTDGSSASTVTRH